MCAYAPQNDDRQRVRDASDIVAVVGEHLSLKAKGREYVGLCPFHDDRNPSMCVVPTKQIFHCFVCGAGGDVFSFIQKYHSMDFREALEFLAERANIELTKFNPSSAPGDQPYSGVGRREIINANEFAAGYFQAILKHPEHGAIARGLIERRGISPEMVERFGIGASADRWDGLSMMIDNKKLDRNAFAAAGLLKQRDTGGEYDALRNRLIFPIHDQIGRVIAFGGRKINEEDEPKYLNSPETAVFNKSTTLFGIHHAARAIKQRRTAVIVEGYTDVIACHQAGVEHVVGTLGTALTSGHATILRRLCDTVVLLFDGDEAGQRAADRAIEVLFRETIDIKIAALAGYTDAKDPDELLKREGGAAIFEQAIHGAEDLLKWRFDRLRRSLADAGPARMTQAIEDELTRLNDLGIANLSPIRRRLVVRQIANAAGIEEAVVINALRAGRRAPRRESLDEREHTDLESGWKPGARELLLGCLLCDDQLWLSMSGEERDLISAGAFRSGMSRRVAQATLDAIEDGAGSGLHAVLGVLSETDARDGMETSPRATALYQIVSRETEGNDERLHRMFRECVNAAALLELKRGHPDENEMSDAARLRAFIEQQRKVRDRFGKGGKATLHGE
ncbi:MAG: DNA primase [Phycisphaerales bacterium]|nr:DNA primase [Phycisphaerales bacterium]